MPLQLDKAYLTAIWLETLFYGTNFVLFCGCVTTLTLYRRTARVNKFLLTVAAVMFAFSTAHVSLGFQRLIEGFIHRRDQPGGPGAFFSDVSIPANVVKVGIHTVNSIIGDSVVVWRCWLVWSKDWKMCIVPILLIIASAICGFAQTVYFARAKALHSAFAHILQVWNGSLFSLSLATNVTVTLLISLRVWYMLRLHDGKRAHFRYWRVLLIIIESGMVYSVALVCEITLYFLNSNAFYIVYDPIAQLTAITPTVIIILAALQLTSNDVHSRLTRTTNHGPRKPHDNKLIRLAPGGSHTTESTELGSMRFADNRGAVVTTLGGSFAGSTGSGALEQKDGAGVFLEDREKGVAY